MLRLSPPDFARLEQAHQFNAHVGGAEFNVAIGAARLGLETAWISRLPQNPLGRLVRNKAREQGVDTSGIDWAETGRVGVYFVEMGAAPRPSSVLYDRSGSAIAEMKGDEFDWNRLLHGARGFHTTGITPALGPGAAQSTRAALKAARAAGCLTSYDLNYRNRLWTPEQACKVQTELMENVDVLITTEEDAHVVFGISPGAGADLTYANLEAESYVKVARALAERFKFKAVAITMRKNPSVWRNQWSALVFSQGQVYRSAEYDLEVVDRIGGGDSLAAGLLASYLKEGDWGKAVNFGVAFSALKHSIPGDCNWTTEAEVKRLLGGSSMRVAR